MPFRIVDLWRLFHGYLLIRHFRTFSWIVLSVLVRWVAGTVLLRPAALAAVDAGVLQTCILAGIGLL